MELWLMAGLEDMVEKKYNITLCKKTKQTPQLKTLSPCIVSFYIVCMETLIFNYDI